MIQYSLVYICAFSEGGKTQSTYLTFDKQLICAGREKVLGLFLSFLSSFLQGAETGASLALRKPLTGMGRFLYCSILKVMRR